MNSIAISLFVVFAGIMEMNCLPAYFKAIGHYGTVYGLRKTYYYSGVSTANGSTHAELCTSVGLEPLRLSSDEEQEYFLNVIRNTQTTLHTHIGADKMGEDWIWQGTRERIHYPVRWYPSYPNSNAAWTCLMVANYWATKANTAFFNHPCDHIYPYICQKTGNLN